MSDNLGIEQFDKPNDGFVGAEALGREPGVPRGLRPEPVHLEGAGTLPDNKAADAPKPPEAASPEAKARFRDRLEQAYSLSGAEVNYVDVPGGRRLHLN